MRESPLRPASGLPEKALQACAEDLGVAAADLQALAAASRANHYKSQIFYVGRRGVGTPDHVVKVDASRDYDPQHEMEALAFAARVIGSGEFADLLGVVQPVACGSDPSFLCTRHQPGELAQIAFDATVLGWRSPRPVERARSHARLIARWLASFRSLAAVQDGGLSPADYLTQIQDMAGKVRSQLGAARAMDAVEAHVQSYVEQLGEEDRTRLVRRYPNRGDARPKNFLAGSDGVFYALDMEGFGYGPLEHDLSCLHHYLEYGGVRSSTAAGRAAKLWAEFWDEYMALGNSPTFALLGYVHYLLERIPKAQSGGWRRRLRSAIWIRNRLRWLARLSGDLRADARQMRTDV